MRSLVYKIQLLIFVPCELKSLRYALAYIRWKPVSQP